MAGCISSLLVSSLASSSYSGYKRAWTLLAQCMRQLKVPYHGTHSLPLNTNLLMLFIGFLHMTGYAPASITSYTCAIGYVHKFKSLPDPTSSFIIQRLLAAITKVNTRCDTRLPITITVLRQLVLSLGQTSLNTYIRFLLKAMFLVAFYGLMRIGEITTDLKGQATLMIEHLTFEQGRAILSISHFKHNSSSRPFQIVLSKQRDDTLCPLRALQSYMQMRGNQAGPLFCFPGLQPVSRSFFINKLNFLLNFCGLSRNLYKSHSFRIGAASFYASLGLSDEQIRLLGRWKSTAFRKYIRCQRVIGALPE